MAETSFVSTAIPYVNARPHLGHAFEFVMADVWARRTASNGAVFLSSGTDENATKNVRAATQAGLAPADFVAGHSAAFASLLTTLDVHPDRFVRTSIDEAHRTSTSRFWTRWTDGGHLYQREYEGRYCTGCEAFLSSAKLIGHRCPVHRTVAEQVRERTWFFRLSRHRDALARALDDGSLRIHPAGRAKEVRALVAAGLHDVCVSRPLARTSGWGIPVPGDSSQVMYVWIDALISYISALGWGDSAPEYDRYWQGARRRVHVFGKDVLLFHAVYWPTMLMAAGLPLPTDLVVHGHLTAGGRKISKSGAAAVAPTDLTDRYGPEALRWLLLAGTSPWSDADVDERLLVELHNRDLADGVGNLVARVAGLGHSPGPGAATRTAVAAEDRDRMLVDGLDRDARATSAALDTFEIHEAVAGIRRAVHRTNAHLQARAPWSLAGEDRIAAVETARRAVAVIASMLAPLLPRAASHIVRALEDPTVGAIVFPRLEITW
jgi:methionyl-tRNA synthetase